jgi:hypothetical protein
MRNKKNMRNFKSLKVKIIIYNKNKVFNKKKITGYPIIGTILSRLADVVGPESWDIYFPA